MDNNILDETIRRDVQLQRFATSMVKNFVNPTAQDIARNIGSFLIGYEDLSSAEKRKVISDVKKYTSENWGSIWVGFGDEMDELMDQEGQFMLDLYDDFTPEQEVFIAPRSLPPASAVMSTGTTAGTWANFVAANINDTVKAVNSVVQLGIRDGATTQQMVSELRGKYNRRTKSYEGGILTGRQVNRAEALARTGVSHYVNGVRDKFAQDNKDIIEKRIFFATLDSRTTQICLANHLREWDIDDKSYPKLPLHFNERSVYIFKTEGFNPLSVTRPAQKGLKEEGKRDYDQISGKTTSSAWLRRQPRWFVEESLGKEKARLFLDGGLDIKSMVDTQNRPLTLAQLKETSNGAKAFRKLESKDD